MQTQNLRSQNSCNGNCKDVCCSKERQHIPSQGLSYWNARPLSQGTKPKRRQALPVLLGILFTEIAIKLLQRHSGKSKKSDQAFHQINRPENSEKNKLDSRNGPQDGQVGTGKLGCFPELSFPFFFPLTCKTSRAITEAWKPAFVFTVIELL